ncbi:hypothetical protein EVAR_22310_1 [Eumeta japonica]|uniref:Uncharacterized protein n=1 Tax=Eumeta variegata TaxID=151549 RepID=A0A4C1UBE1_EUMVA|nr:hypothetical protein EVAR_22310_1 [Eumeta japonica]
MAGCAAWMVQPSTLGNWRSATYVWYTGIDGPSSVYPGGLHPRGRRRSRPLNWIVRGGMRMNHMRLRACRYNDSSGAKRILYIFYTDAAANAAGRSRHRRAVVGYSHGDVTRRPTASSFISGLRGGRGRRGRPSAVYLQTVTVTLMRDGLDHAPSSAGQASLEVHHLLIVYKDCPKTCPEHGDGQNAPRQRQHYFPIRRLYRFTDGRTKLQGFRFRHFGPEPKKWATCEHLPRHTDVQADNFQNDSAEGTAPARWRRRKGVGHGDVRGRRPRHHPSAVQRSSTSVTLSVHRTRRHHAAGLRPYVAGPHPVTQMIPHCSHEPIAENLNSASSLLLSSSWCPILFIPLLSHTLRPYFHFKSEDLELKLS